VAHFSHSVLSLQSDNTGLTLNFGQCVIKERQNNIIHGTLLEVSKQQAGCVCSGGSSSYSTTIKEAVFCNFDLTYFTCCLHPPSPQYSFEEGGLLEGQVKT
jgi:hypothetical protein